tara:strand:- start:134999 stop:136021 length:1023 start_codon:yes stop_codon:yes gene_type:complete
MSKIFILYFIFVQSIVLCAQSPESLRFAFYNVENLFDTIDDVRISDEEFLPNGSRFWNSRKYQSKLSAISKTIVGIQGWQNLGMIALAEIENQRVLEDLVSRPELKKQKLKIIHKDSPDRRGIDIGIIYNPQFIEIKKIDFIPLKDSLFPKLKSRDMVYVKVKIFEDYELHFFACHWPSRYGGQVKSEPKRILAAKILRAYVDSIQEIDSLANILIMGDFNDEWTNKSLRQYLRAQKPSEATNGSNLLNLMSSLPLEFGSHKYQGEWAYLDQIIVNHSLMNLNSQGLKIENFEVLELPFLLEEDLKYLGLKPNRTYNGFKYNGGFSDHLAIFADLTLIKL